MSLLNTLTHFWHSPTSPLPSLLSKEQGLSLKAGLPFTFRSRFVSFTFFSSLSIEVCVINMGSTLLAYWLRVESRRRLLQAATFLSVSWVLHWPTLHSCYVKLSCKVFISYFFSDFYFHFLILATKQITNTRYNKFIKFETQDTIWQVTKGSMCVWVCLPFALCLFFFSFSF